METKVKKLMNGLAGIVPGFSREFIEAITTVDPNTFKSKEDFEKWRDELSQLSHSQGNAPCQLTDEEFQQHTALFQKHVPEKILQAVKAQLDDSKELFEGEGNEEFKEQIDDLRGRLLSLIRLSLEGRESNETIEKLITAIFDIAKTFTELLDRLKKTALTVKRKLTPTPHSLPQQCFPEMQIGMQGLVDDIDKWEDVPGEIALYYGRPGEQLQLKFVPSRFWGREDITCSTLKNELDAAVCDTVILYNFLVAWALEESQVITNLDALIKIMGFDPRSSADRAELHRLIWRWMRMFDSMLVCGKRKSYYPDQATKQRVDLNVEGTLLAIEEVGWPDGVSNDNPPHEVVFRIGSRLRQLANDKQSLTYFGDMTEILNIPAKQPSGKWARCIALHLNYLWRVNSKNAQPGRAGEDKHLTVKYRDFSRWELLQMFRTTPWVLDLLDGPNPQRAREYWNEAIKILKQKGIIGYYSPNTVTKEDKKNGRLPRNWSQSWLYDDKMDIRPSKQWAETSIEIRQKVDKARKKALQGKNRKKLKAAQ